jgi:hypothetical protein
VAGYQSPVPAQDGCWCDEQADPAWVGQSADQDGDQCSVGPTYPGSSGLAAAHRELVAQHQNLNIFHGLGPGEQH